MRKRLAIAALATLILVGTATAATQPMIAALKKLGAATDNMAANISTAQSDADAELLVRVTRQVFESQLKDLHPILEFSAKAGYCRVTIATPQWNLWSEARGGTVVDHGAKIH